VRPIITFVIFASGLKYIGLSTVALGWTLCATALLLAGVWVVRSQPWRNSILEQASPTDPRGAPEVDSETTSLD
jgi:hypothetical protein